MNRILGYRHESVHRTCARYLRFAPDGLRERLYSIALSQDLGVGYPVLPTRFVDYTKEFHIEYVEPMNIGLEYVPGFTSVRSNCEDAVLQNTDGII